MPSNFIGEWTPLHTRLVAHRIGDGTIDVHKNAVWNNKRICGFLRTSAKLNIKLRKPVTSDVYGTYKIVIPKELFSKFAELVSADEDLLRNSSQYLLDNILKMSEEHKLQAILALIFDDGCCKNWLLIVFEDPNKDLVEKALQLWQSLFGDTAWMASHKTKRGLDVFHIYANREGIIQLYNKISAFKYRPYFTDLWEKQKDLEERYLKTQSKKALEQVETGNKQPQWEKIIVEHLFQNRHTTILEAQRILRLTKDRTRKCLERMRKKKIIFLSNMGRRSRYTLEAEENDFVGRSKILLDYLKNHNQIVNKDTKQLLDLSASHSYKILKKMVTHGLLKQIKSSCQKTRYILPEKLIQ